MMQRLFRLCLTAALTASAIPALANHDAVQFGSNIVVGHDETLHDAVCFFCSVDVEGQVDHDIVVFFGNVHVANRANHDIVNFFGTVSADDNASIGNSLVSMFGGVRLGQNVSVGRDLVSMFGGVHASGSVTVGGDRVVEPGWLLGGPFLLIGLVVFLVVRELRAYRRRQFYGRYPLPPQP
jgi:hypothetical protein